MSDEQKPAEPSKLRVLTEKVRKKCREVLGFEEPHIYLDERTLRVALGESQIVQAFFRTHRWRWKSYVIHWHVEDGELLGATIESTNKKADEEK